MANSIEVATIVSVLAVERKRLRTCRAHDFETNRARSSAATEDAISRVLMLEELLDPATVPLAREDKPTAGGRTGRNRGAPSGDNTLDLQSR